MREWVHKRFEAPSLPQGKHERAVTTRASRSGIRFNSRLRFECFRVFFHGWGSRGHNICLSVSFFSLLARLVLLRSFTASVSERRVATGASGRPEAWKAIFGALSRCMNYSSTQAYRYMYATVATVRVRIQRACGTTFAPVVGKFSRKIGFQQQELELDQGRAPKTLYVALYTADNDGSIGSKTIDSIIRLTLISLQQLFFFYILLGALSTLRHSFVARLYDPAVPSFAPLTSSRSRAVQS